MTTRKHFRAAAETLWHIRPGELRDKQAQALIRLFNDDNPRFDVDIFLRAAGYTAAEAETLKESL